MKKNIICLLLVIILSIPTVSLAQLHDDELYSFLQTLEWNQQHLEQYLASYDRSLADFETLTELKAFLGEPINEDNLNQLLTKYQLTHDELERLLADFGESLEDYRFIEDLDTEISFYLDHSREYQLITGFLSILDLTAEELDQFLDHLYEIEQDQFKQQLTSLEATLTELRAQHDQMGELNDTALRSLLNQMIETFNVEVDYKWETDNEAREDVEHVTTLSEAPGPSLFVSVFNQDGNLIADMTVDEEVFASDVIVEAASETVNLAQLSTNLNETVIAAKLPQTASPYSLNTAFGLLLSVFSLFMFIRAKTSKWTP
ncbi:processed acidic surface protein [Desertibacillus haloalkaliphilus]|uniref:processed acidic surface protein n=1 Tax=Desertibacillus haloalkaliphilus TaxID=1328930 RepID=UPI001C2610FE|nr:processed acidic surface protein [Desertibacillus haloalkaliphilus]MBU8908044.1 processed acidic surface protein [Desertibacillus haloalkaliphilus]